MPSAPTLERARHTRSTRPPAAPQAPVERPTAGERFDRYLVRLTAFAAIAGLVALQYVILAPVLPESARFWEREPAAPQATAAGEGAAEAAPAAEEAAPLPPRPESAPQRIPQWAWQMHNWHLTPPAERGARPASAPQTLPAWYWEWRAYRLALAER